uniref:Uncharacterized protein n=1 Tax=Oryzias latipes TaxID=8090 RepID=A0A3P9JG85_ORYLA
MPGNDEEAVVDRGKTSSTLHTNFEKEELESDSVFKNRKRNVVPPSGYIHRHVSSVLYKMIS